MKNGRILVKSHDTGDTKICSKLEDAINFIKEQESKDEESKEKIYE